MRKLEILAELQCSRDSISELKLDNTVHPLDVQTGNFHIPRWEQPRKRVCLLNQRQNVIAKNLFCERKLKIFFPTS